jgi:RHS repeat-associated protein
MSGGVALQLRYSDGAPANTRYLTHDHLGSTDRITDEAGNVLVAESFGAFGHRRRPSWNSIPTAADLAKIAAATRDGFTGHEHLDNLDLVHMSGRVYDPRIARFISADPYATQPFHSQGLNRYSYVLNNPLAFTDPSGFDAVPCLANEAGTCVQITVIGLTWTDYMRTFGGAHSAEIASSLERDPCGQNGGTLACSMASGALVPPSSIVLTVGRQPNATLSTGGRLDALQGFAARVGNLAIGSSPIAMLFGADPDFQYFREPDSTGGRAGALAGNAGYLLGGAAGMVRRAGPDLLKRGPSVFARSLQGTPK